MNNAESKFWSFCRRCGGERRHALLAEESRPWAEQDTPVHGNDRWSIVECCGCEDVSFVHTHWFSEDTDYTDQGLEPIVYRDIYPPAPARKPPEWGVDFQLSVPLQDQWIVKLHSDIYAAMGFGAYTLAAMGVRSIVDFIVTSKATDKGTFLEKLARLKDQRLISDAHVDIVSAAFDAGSAAAHRGYSPPVEDLNLLLDVMESLFEQIFLEPVRLKRRSVEAVALRSRTPRRPKPIGS